MKELSDKEVMQAAIEKAIKGGWKGLEGWELDLEHPGLIAEEAYNDFVSYCPLDIIFDHDFVKTLWGDWPQFMKDAIPKGIKAVTDIPMWQYHGTQMFLAEDRIDYLRKNMNDG